MSSQNSLNEIRYFHAETRERIEKDLKELFDINFGKDGRLFLSLYYSKKFGKHGFHYKDPVPAEGERFKNKNLAGTVRDGYFACCKDIMNKYLLCGKEEALKCISDNMYRFAGYFKKNGKPEVIISDDLYNLHKGITPNTESNNN